MTETSGQEGKDFVGSTEPAGEWGFGPAGWSVAYTGEAPPSPAADEDPEAVALRLWSEGRKEEALAFLEGKLAREHPGDGNLIAAQEETARALALIASPAAAAARLDATRPAQAVTLLAPPAEKSTKLIHLAPEPRIGDARSFRVPRAGALRRVARPTPALAAALMLGSVALGAAFWPEGDRPEAAPTADTVAAAPQQPPAEPVVLNVASTLPDDSSTPQNPALAPRDLPNSEAVRAEAPEPEPAPPPEEFASEDALPVESVAAAVEDDAAPPLPEPAAQPITAASAESSPQSALPAQAEPAPPIARLPNPRPHYVERRPTPASREELAALDIPPIPPEDDFDLPDTYEYLPGPRYYRLPPVLVERRAAAQRYAAARRGRLERRNQRPSPVEIGEEPVFTVEGPVILRAARGLLP